MLWLALLIMSLGGAFASEAAAFRVTPADKLAGFQSNPLTVLAPEGGTLTINIRDEHTLYRTLTFQVEAGKNQVIWDGLGWNEEILAKKSFRMESRLTGKSGTAYSAAEEISMGAAQQAVLFALPSDGILYPEDAGDWFLEMKMLYTDELVVEFFREDTGEKTLEMTKQVKGGRVNQIPYRTFAGKQKPEPGTYRVRVWGRQDPANAKSFTLQVKDGKRPTLPLRVTGDIMPRREDSDAEIWERMTAPATVIDIRNVAHQRVYAEADAHSRVLGTLHGQSQSVSVLEIGEQWVRIGAWNHESGAPVEGWVPKRVLKVVQPQTKYGLLVDKKAQTLTLFEDGKRVDTLLVSTGRMAKGELYQETAAGSFLTDLHMADYSTNGLKYDFVIRYDGGNLLHQIPYAWNESGKKDMGPGEIYLGTKASHACIRIQEKPGDSGLNAYWFWTHLPYRTRVIVLDDPEERTKLETLVTGQTPDLEEGLGGAWRVEEEPGEGKMITLTFGGDSVLGGRESYYGDEAGLPAFLEAEGTEWPFAALRAVFEKDDLTCVNLECVLKDDPEGEDLGKQWRFRGLTRYTDALVSGNIEMVNVANNHTIDYGDAGYRSTLEALSGQILTCGNEINTVIDIQGHRFGFGGCRESTYTKTPDVIGQDIQALREAGAEFVIYQCHWGTEYAAQHNVLQEAMARACQRAGADLVIGHHPHVVQGIDFIDGMPVVYSLGNLMFGGTIRMTTYDGILVQAIFDPERESGRVRLRLIPILTSGSAGKRVNDYQPRIAEGDDALRILKKVQADTPFLLTEKVSVLY
ncbi:MAG: CapA family protein [Clostridia bacterium]|nr:CapA family protein [Clostridia bacterium]